MAGITAMSFRTPDIIAKYSNRLFVQETSDHPGLRPSGPSMAAYCMTYNSSNNASFAFCFIFLSMVFLEESGPVKGLRFLKA